MLIGLIRFVNENCSRLSESVGDWGRRSVAGAGATAGPVMMSTGVRVASDAKREHQQPDIDVGRANEPVERRLVDGERP